MKIYNYLALGDSYTIGEQVPIDESFPYQTVQLLRKKGLYVYAPEIIATTGWTTDELNEGMDATAILSNYSFVSLLIGVNNQYRGRTAENFRTEFENLLQRGIHFAGSKSAHVFVISIPDWGVTPFARGKDIEKIAREIDAYNLICASAAKKFQTHFIDITVSQRQDGNKEEFLAADKLHPSGKEYAKWAAQLSEKIFKVI